MVGRMMVHSKVLSLMVSSAAIRIDRDSAGRDVKMAVVDTNTALAMPASSVAAATAGAWPNPSDAKLASASKEVAVTIDHMSANMKKSGLSAEEAASAMANFNKTLGEAQVAAAGVAVAQTELAESSAVAATATNALERTMAAGGGRALGAAAGMGAMGGAMGRVAALIPGFGEAFAVIFPIALIAMGVEKFEQYREAIAKAGREATELATDSYKIADAIEVENLKLTAQIDKLENHPVKNVLLEALLADKAEAEEVSKALESLTQHMNDLLTVGSIGQLFSAASGDEAGAKARLQPIVNDLIAAQLKLSQAPAGSADAKKSIQDQIDLYKKLSQAIDMEILHMEASGERGGKFINADSIAKLQEFQIAATNAVKSLREVQDQSGLRNTLGNLEQTKAVEDYWAKYTGGFAKANRELAEHSAFWKKFYSEQITEANRVAEESQRISVEGARETSEQMAAISRREADTNIANAEDDAKRAETAIRDAQAKAKQSQVGTTGSFAPMAAAGAAKAELATLNTQIQQVQGAIARLHTDMANIQNQPGVISNADLEAAARYRKELETLEMLLARFGDEQAQLAKTQETTSQAMVHAADESFDAFNQGFLKTITGAQSFSRTLQQVWTKMAETFISAALRTIEQMLINAALQKSIADSTKLSDAAAAARHTYASVSAIPFVGPFLAPELAAAAFAAVLAFEEGGLIPGSVGTAVPIVAHAGETVIPENITRKLNQATGDGNASRPIEFNYHVNANNIDTKGMTDALREHGEFISNMVLNELRKKNVA